MALPVRGDLHRCLRRYVTDGPCRELLLAGEADDVVEVFDR